MIPDELREIFDEFIIEADEHLDSLENRLLELEKNPTDQELINAAFRSMHTLKGGAGFLGLTVIVEVAHKAEDILGKVKEGKLRFDREISNVLLNAADFIREAIKFYDDGESVSEPIELLNSLSKIQGEKIFDGDSEYILDNLLDKYGLSDLKGMQIEDILEEIVLMPPNKRPQELIDLIEKIISSQTSQIPKETSKDLVSKLEEEATNSILRVVDDEITKSHLKKKKEDHIRYSESQSLEMEEKTLKKEPKKDKEDERLLRIDVQKIESLMNLVGEIVLERNRLIRAVGDMSQHIVTNKYLEEIESIAYSIDKIVGDLQLAVMKTRMQPVKRLFQKFSRVVRDLSLLIAKEVEFITQGEDTEMDKSILEKLEEPLIHLIRNSLDHGIETPDERRMLGKNQTGKLILRAYYQGDRVYLEVEDDGRGIDTTKVAQKAIEKGIVTKEQIDKMTEKDIQRLVFLPGFSTRENISEISGRGVGMDSVMKTVLNFRGTIDIWSEKGKGTKISMAFPLTVGIIRSLLVSVSGRRFAIPIFLVTEIIPSETAEIHSLSGKKILILRGTAIPLIDIHEVLNIPPSNTGYIIVCLIGNQRIALTVEDLFGDEEIVVKPLGKIFGDLKGISGATITGDGKIVLILDIVELLKRKDYRV